ncbi:hypothetical protein FGO68_gene8717 [Halteria grandinella]|uniref:Uncharacterized protein n=1 Tax=Halteria grandinella TaxID=5974 RepID=A0A8J8NRV4_HALGN|nr:hypothetical protein FGO68_gene8717 [Halteria grandinella]
MIDVFTDFEMENQVWNKEKFIHKCNEAYNKMPQGDRSLLLKFFEKSDPQKRRNSSTGSQTAKKQIKPEINANSAQMCLSVRQYGVNTNELLYNQAQNIQRKKEQLREKYDQTSQCTFKPAINKDFKKVNGSQMPQSVMERSFRQTASEAQFKPVRAAVNVISPYKKQ